MKSKLLRLAIIGIGTASASSSVVYGQVDKPRDIPALTYDYVEKQFDQDREEGRERKANHEGNPK